ncbi:SUN2 protein, partial [Penelope pileata]|nr:SUN2 protein [Penelope pileata]
VSPGYCWPFQESQSQLLIRLPTPIQPIAVTIQHTSKVLSSHRATNSAPRDFTISVSLCWALGAGTWLQEKLYQGVDEKGEKETQLGTFTYAVEKEPSQTFHLQTKTTAAFQNIKLVVQSNWGTSRYTCIHRIQVHGKLLGTNGIGQ